MTPKRWQQIKKLFEAAADLRPEDRHGFLEDKCGGDTDLYEQVNKLISSSELAETFLETPAAEAETIFESAETGSFKNTTGGIEKSRFVSGTILGDRYRIVGLLGKGGMGEVYKAEDLKLDQIVALKFLPDKLEKNKEALRRFIGEVRIARQVSHPNVCRVFDIGELDGRHYISMEFIDGDDLSVLLQRIGRLPSDKAAEISRQICFGLHAIHDAGILHRDLKPANVIIDRVGKARITDFGIAGFDSDFRNEEIRVGTPAYMSPEQIDGKEVTVKSDIYSLGLLIYEIYTGKQAFEADSLDELLKKQRTTAPKHASTLVENIEPIVEQTINNCLEKNPARRPSSGLQVALALPGGNPLEAAIMAGETPSPEMVAAAPKKGALKPVVAGSLLLAVIVLFGSFVYLNGKYKLYSVSPLEKSPEVLAERAKSVIRNLGYTKTPVDSIYEFKSDVGYLDYENENGNPSGSWHKLKTGQPLGMYFWYRQSPTYIVPSGYSLVTEADPPLSVSGMVNVKLDPLGRLVEFVTVPLQEQADDRNSKTNWDLLFKEAGLDRTKFEEVDPKWHPPVYSNSRIAWTGNYADHDDIPIRIEAASFNGSPVFFQVVAPWDKPWSEQETNGSVFRKAAQTVVIIVTILVIIGAIILARKNLLAGRGDLKGALKLGTAYFLLMFVSEFVRSHHVPTIAGELHVFYEVASYVMINSFFVFLVYIALEPFVRRWWSELLISWSRLLAGDFKDPIIGRDVLVGALFGLGHTFAIYFGSFLRDIVKGKPLIIDRAFLEKFFSGTAGSLTDLAELLLQAINTGLFALFLLLLFYVLFRNKWLSIVIVWALMFAVTALAFVLTQHWVFAITAIIHTTVFVVTLVRFGLLAMISFWLFFYISWLMPVTLDSSRFYFFDSLLVIGFTIAIAFGAFYISLAGQPLFGGSTLEENEG